MKSIAISTGAQPMPISTIAAVIIQGSNAAAKTNAPPAPPRASSKDAVRFGPNRSSDTPMANWARANAMKNAPEASDRLRLGRAKLGRQGRRQHREK